MCPCVISTHILIWKYFARHAPRPYYAIFIFLIWEDVPKISVTLTPPLPYKENPCIPKIQVYSTSLYKQHVFSFPKYAEKSLTLSLQSSWKFLIHWLNLRRNFGQYPISAFCLVLSFLFFRYPLERLRTIISLMIFVHHQLRYLKIDIEP